MQSKWIFDLQPKATNFMPNLAEQSNIVTDIKYREREERESFTWKMIFGDENVIESRDCLKQQRWIFFFFLQKEGKECFMLRFNFEFLEKEVACTLGEARGESEGKEREDVKIISHAVFRQCEKVFALLNSVLMDSSMAN